MFLPRRFGLLFFVGGPGVTVHQEVNKHRSCRQARAKLFRGDWQLGFAKLDTGKRQIAFEVFTLLGEIIELPMPSVELLGSRRIESQRRELGRGRLQLFEPRPQLGLIYQQTLTLLSLPNAPFPSQQRGVSRFLKARFMGSQR